MRIVKYFLFTFLLIIQFIFLKANDSLTIVFNQKTYKQNDSIQIDVTLLNSTKANHLMSLHLWMENIQTHQRWQYRYPLINGYAHIEFGIQNTISNGVYAFSFLLNKQFYTIKGVVLEGNKKDNSVQYLLLTKNNNIVNESLNLDNKKQFNLKNLVYPDTAFIVFSPQVKKRRNYLALQIETPLDSTFIPLYKQTFFIAIGENDSLNAKLLKNISYNSDDFIKRKVWDEVVVVGKRKGLLQKFGEENISSLFNTIDEVVIDGLTTDEIANAPDLYTFLISKIPGLNILTDTETGNRILTWRKEVTTIYLNELKLGENEFQNINTDDIALIKFFRSNTVLSNTQGGILAIYTKTPGYDTKTKNKYSFKIMGYNPLINSWK